MNNTEDKILCKNLHALSQADRQLETRIRWPVDQSHLAMTKENEPAFFLHTSWICYRVTQRDILKTVPLNQEYNILFGIGAGEIIEYLLSQDRHCKVIAWDRDPALLRFVLSRIDLSDAILCGRLKLLLGIDLAGYLNLFSGDNVIFHPFFEKIYHQEKRIVENGVIGEIALVALGGLFVEDLTDSLTEYGYTVWPVDLTKWSIEELTLIVQAVRPCFLCSINYLNGANEFCEKLKIVYICWEIDPNMENDLEVRSKAAFSNIFTYRRKNVKMYEQAGFSNVHYLPLASNTVKRNHQFTDDQDDGRYRVKVAYVGMSMVNESKKYHSDFVQLYKKYKPDDALCVNECEHKIQLILNEQIKDGSTYVVPELFEKEFSDFKKYLTSCKVSVDPMKIVAHIASSERRIHYIAMIEEEGVHVWGDGGWKSIEQYGATYRGYAGHKLEINKIYGNARINIDIGRIYQLDIVTMRVFDVLACGGFLISEYSDELESLFNIGKEVESYKTIDELNDKIRFYSQHKSYAEKIALSGLEAVRKRHSFKDRVGLMLSHSIGKNTRTSDYN